MSGNCTRAERTAARQRFEDKEKHAQDFAASIKQSREYSQLQVSTNSIINREKSGSLKDLKSTPFFCRFEGVLIEQSLIIIDVVERWNLRNELQSEIGQEHSIRRKEKLQM